MKFTVNHKAKGQLDIDLAYRRLSEEEADVLYYALVDLPGVHNVRSFPERRGLFFVSVLVKRKAQSSSNI